MFRCHVCGADEAQQGWVDEVFQIEGQNILVEHIPALVCTHCEEPVFSRETTEKIRRMVHGEAKPVKSVQMDVFVYA